MNGYLDALPVSKVRPFEDALLSTLRTKHADLLTKIRDSKDLSDDSAKTLKGILESYRASRWPKASR